MGLLTLEEVLHWSNPYSLERTYAGWKTLNIMGFHPSSRKLLRLATVEVKEESQHVTLFWKDRPCFTEKEKSLTNRIHALK